MIVDSAIYVDGERRAAPASLQETFEASESMRGVAWIDLVEPDTAVFAAVATEFGLHELSVQDAVRAHQRPKVERYGHTLFVVLKAARYVDSAELVDLDEVHVFVGERFVITVRHGLGPDLVRVHQHLEGRADLLRRGPQAILYGILDQVVDEYGPVVAGLSNDIDEIETEVFGGTRDVTKRTYDLSREVIEFQRAVAPVSRMVAGLMDGGSKYGLDAELVQYLRDVQDHAMRIQEQIASFRELLQNIVTVNLSIVGQRQNDEIRAMTEASLQQNDEIRALSEATFRQSEEVKKISAWAAILFAPTLIGTVYGMNFDHMPELGWRYGYPLALALMVLTGVALYLVFRARGWVSSTG
ncbi:MAG: Magnesium and cobalt transport protein CorA [uncultured Thermomicrobiales bacterium]|uniref:Magnesium and cobalt transport protein CorA n=1 Tax=uncultured Thermomicrobiales bacterium TaxID=1645740 RepID=A0A6J4V0X6_9BACT|nr:MAG: Magnesium and cobalt transport protein CorA [uncultured Thermomicrobiales bacterium]